MEVGDVDAVVDVAEIGDVIAADPNVEEATPDREVRGEVIPACGSPAVSSPLSSCFKRRKRAAASRIRLNSMQNAWNKFFFSNFINSNTSVL